MTNWDYIDTYLDLTYGKRDLVIIDRDAEGNCIGPDEKAVKIQDLTRALIALEGAEMHLDFTHDMMIKHLITDERAKKQHYDQMNEMWNRYIQIWRKAIKRELYRLKYQEVTE